MQKIMKIITKTSNKSNLIEDGNSLPVQGRCGTRAVPVADSILGLDRRSKDRRGNNAETIQKWAYRSGKWRNCPLPTDCKRRPNRSTNCPGYRSRWRRGDPFQRTGKMRRLDSSLRRRNRVSTSGKCRADRAKCWTGFFVVRIPHRTNR